MSRAAAIELTALEHLRELWLRLMGSIVVMFAGGGVTYVFRLQIINFLQRPLGEKLYYTSPTGSFQFIMQVCLLCGTIVALPILIYNVLRYIEPAFNKGFSRRFVALVLCASLLLTAAGVIFAYYLTLPVALKFFSSVGTSTLHPLISVNQYFGFILGYLATFAIVFQLPLLLLFINHITPFQPGGLTKWRKHIYIGAFAISLIMPSSPDPLSQVSLAIPIITLYELSVILIWKVNRKKRKRAAKLERLRAAHAARAARFAPHAKPQLAKPVWAAGLGEADEVFAISRLQEALRRREEQGKQMVAVPVAISQPAVKSAPRITAPVSRAGRTTYYQRPARRASQYASGNGLGRARSDIIQDML